VFSLFDFRSHNGVALGVKPKLRLSLESGRVDRARDASIAASYSLTVAENTKQRIWKARVRAEFERLL
jgi:hypothetical protein